MDYTVYFADKAVVFTAKTPGEGWYAVTPAPDGGISRAKVTKILESYNSVAVLSPDPEAAFAAFAAEFTSVEAAGGIVVAVPVIVYQVWRFVRPGLRRRENLAFGLIMTVGLVLFGLGAAFAFLIVLPLLLAFFARLNTSGTVTAMVSVQEYVAYVVNTMITFGVVFETPMAILALIGTGLVKPKTLRKNFKYAVLVILIVAAVITPPDVVSQLLIAAPLMILFYGSILAGQLIFRRKLKEAEELENG